MDRERNELYLGLVFSVLGHALALLLFLGAIGPGLKNIGTPIVYSVSIEGGKSLGGISQLAKDDKPSRMAPPKAASEPQKPEQVSSKDKEAEISLAEEKKRKAEEEKRVKEEEERKKKLQATPKPTRTPTAAEISKRLAAAVQRYTGESSDAGGQGFGAGALGGSGMGGGLLRPPAFFEYRDRLKEHIKSGWRWYDTTSELIAVIEFQIEPDGRLEGVRLVSGSGNSEYDDSVYRAVLKSSPVPVPPLEVYQDFFRKVTMRFDPRE